MVKTKNVLVSFNYRVLTHLSTCHAARGLAFVGSGAYQFKYVLISPAATPVAASLRCFNAYALPQGLSFLASHVRETSTLFVTCSTWYTPDLRIDNRRLNYECRNYSPCSTSSLYRAYVFERVTRRIVTPADRLLCQE